MPEHDEAAYFAMLRSDKSFYYLRRRAAPGLVEAVNALGEPGIALEREPDRLYPQTSLAAHVIGYTDVDGNGVAGIERALERPAVRRRRPAASRSSCRSPAGSSRRWSMSCSSAMTQILGDRARRAWSWTSIPAKCWR